MKKIKTITQTLLFSIFMSIVVSTAGYNVSSEQSQYENALSACSEEYPNFSSLDSGY